jgi:hypothetical protein
MQEGLQANVGGFSPHLMLQIGQRGIGRFVAAAVHGASVMVAEKASVLGGTSAWSGGWLWIPCNPAAVTAAESPAAPDPTTSTSTFTGPLMMDSLLQWFFTIAIRSPS